MIKKKWENIGEEKKR